MILKCENAPFGHITDDSTLCSQTVAWIHTQSNDKYFDQIQKNDYTIIQPSELQKYLPYRTKIIGITGTNGKTTTASLIYSLLLDLGYKVALQGTRGFFINDQVIEGKGLTTPQLLDTYAHIMLADREKCDFFIMEVSSHAIVQKRIEGLNFALKIHTNITQDHLDFHKTIEEYRRVKNSFLADKTPKLINKDDPYVQFNFENAYTYAIEKAGVFKLHAYSLKDGCSGVVQHFEEIATFESSLHGLYNLYNIVAAISAVKILTQVSLQNICDALEGFGGVAGRLQQVWTKPLVFVDFAHTPDGMKQVFEVFHDRKIAVVFGAGGDRDKTKRPLMGQIAEEHAQKIYVTSDNPRNEQPEAIIDDILKGMANPQYCFVNIDRKVTIQKAVEELHENEVLLILGKGDETYQESNGVKYPFDDAQIVTNFLTQKANVLSKASL